jgi:hypothetical protein
MFHNADRLLARHIKYEAVSEKIAATSATEMRENIESVSAGRPVLAESYRMPVRSARIFRREEPARDRIRNYRSDGAP